MKQNKTEYKFINKKLKEIFKHCVCLFTIFKYLFFPLEGRYFKKNNFLFMKYGMEIVFLC